MRDSRLGESLWMEWVGEGFDLDESSDLLYYTFDHVDPDNEIVRRALASAIQRDGGAESLGKAFSALDRLTLTHGFAGELEGAFELTACDETGETFYGDIVPNPRPVTWIEVPQDG